MWEGKRERTAALMSDLTKRNTNVKHSGRRKKDTLFQVRGISSEREYQNAKGTSETKGL